MEVATKLKILTHPKKAGIPKMLTALSLAEGMDNLLSLERKLIHTLQELRSRHPRAPKTASEPRRPMAGPTSPRPSHAYSCTRNCISL
jgi:hypothetical protein